MVLPWLPLRRLSMRSKLVKKDIHDISVVTSGAGAAGIAIIKLLVAMGLEDVVMCDRHGAIYKGSGRPSNEEKGNGRNFQQKMKKGSIEEVIKGADAFIGVLPRTTDGSLR